MEVKLISVTPNAERLIRAIGRTAYLTYKKKKKGSEKEFIRTILRRGHLSVLEHASATFRIKGGSRAFTHQLVRHRIASYTQQSQRYVDESHFDYVEPNTIRVNQKTHSLFINFIKHAKEVYIDLQKLGVKNEDARFVLPNAVASEIVVTANFREWRHIIELRGSSEAQWEIREIVIEILKKLKKEVPTVFIDFEIDEKGKVIRKIKL